MYIFNRLLTTLASIDRKRITHIAIAVLALALFVFGAGAPNATIGIGK